MSLRKLYAAIPLIATSVCLILSLFGYSPSWMPLALELLRELVKLAGKK